MNRTTGKYNRFSFFTNFSYVDDSTNGIYYQHSGSQGWKKIKGSAAEIQALTNPPMGPSSSFKNDHNVRFQSASQMLPNVANYSRQHQHGINPNEMQRRPNFRQRNDHSYTNQRNVNFRPNNEVDRSGANSSSSKQFNRAYSADYWRKNQVPEVGNVDVSASNIIR